MAEYHHFPIYAKEVKDIPDWMKTTQYWQNAVPLEKLQKHQLKVKMCCAKCEEKVVEEIREVYGVFDVRGERFNSKVVVVSMPPPNSLNEHEVLRRAKKTDKKARFVELDAKEKPKTEEQKKKEAEEAKKKKEAEEKKKKEEEAMKKQQEAWKKQQEAEAAWRKEHEAALANVFTWKKPPMGFYPPEGGYYPGEFFFREFTARQMQEEQEKKKAKEEEDKKKKAKEEEDKKKKAKEEEEKKKKELEAMVAAAAAANRWNPHWNPPYYPQHPYPYYAENSTPPSQWYAPRSFNPAPPPPFERQRDEFSRPYIYY